MTKIKTTLKAALLASVVLLFSCDGGGHYEGQRTEEQRQQFKALNDSMQYLRPGALTLIEQQMQLAEDSLTWYDYYLMYGRHYLLTATPDSLLPYTERTQRYASRLAPQTPRTRGLLGMAIEGKAVYHYLLRHDADTVISLYTQAYELLSQSDLEEHLPDLSANLGDAYVAKGDLPKGSHWYRRALYLVDSLGMPTSQNLTLYMGLGRIYTTLHDYEQAREYYEMADEHFQEMKPNMQSYFLNNYGNYFYYHREYAEALRTFRRLKAHLERYDAAENFDMYLCKVNMADVFLNLDELDSARQYVGEVEEYFHRQGVEAGINYAHTIRIGIALKERNFAEVERILREEGDSQKLNDCDLPGIRAKYLNQYYAAIGDYRRAYAGLRGNVEATDSTEQGIRGMRSADIMMRLTEDTMRLHHQLAMQEHEIAYGRAQTALYTILGTLIILVLLFALWYNHVRKQRLQGRLDILNLRLANARQRISPHFVFNVLNSRMAKSDEQEGDQLMTLAKLIRSNLDLTSEKYVTLAEELDFVQRYVEVERGLIGEDFTFTIEAPGHDVLREIRIPSMLVQILVENAILHGLKGQEGEKRLSIRVEADEQQTRITVSDNGPGFDIRTYDSERSRTGLSIIRNTLAAINQKNKGAKMRYDICNAGGCHAILTIPRNIKLI